MKQLQRVSGRLASPPKSGKTFVILILCVFLSFVLWWVFPAVGKIEYHLVFTGISKGHILPYVARFVPYQDKMMGGTAFAAAALERIVADFQGKAFSFVSLGNEIAGTPEAYFSRGRSSIDALNLLQVETMLVGNLEFIYGQKNLGDLARAARFPFLSTNVRLKEGGKIPTFAVPEKILLPRGDLRVAFLGITPPHTPNESARENIEGLEFLPPGKELKERIENIRKESDLVVLLSQYTNNNLTPPDWDAIREARPDLFVMQDFNIDAPPVIRDGILIKSVSGYNQGKEIEVLDLVISGIPKQITGYSSRRVPIFCDDLTPVEKIKSEIDNMLAQINGIRTERIGEFANDADRQNDAECPVGNLITDSLRAYFKADVAFLNSGGIRNNIKKGDFTLGDLYDALPYDNEGVCLELAGTDIEDLLSISASLRKGLLQTSGCTYEFSHTNPDSYDVKNILINGQPLVGTQTYRVAANEYIAEGGDGYRPFRNGKNIVIGPIQREILKTRIMELCASGPVELKTEGRIKRN